MAKQQRIKITLPLLFFLLFPCFKPAGLEYIAPLIESFFDGWRVFVLMIAAVIYFYQGNISGVFLALSAFVLSRIVSTVINGGDYWSLLVSNGSVLSYCIIIELGMKRNIKGLFQANILCLGILCVTNLMLIILFPQGLYTSRFFTENWLLGYDNSHIPYILPLVCYYAMYADARRLSLSRKLIYIALFSASVYITWSATSVIGCTLFIVIVVMNEMDIRPKVMNCYAYLTAVAVSFVLIVIVRFFEFLQPLLVGVLKKDMTFTHRLGIWERALAMIVNKPLFGWGVLESVDSYARLHASHAHDYFLQLALEGGVIGLSCFIILIIIVCKHLYKARETEYGFLLSGLLFCFFVMFLDESYGMSIPFYGSLVFMYHVDKISASFSQMEPARRLMSRMPY